MRKPPPEEVEEAGSDDETGISALQSPSQISAEDTNNINNTNTEEKITEANNTINNINLENCNFENITSNLNEKTTLLTVVSKKKKKKKFYF